MQITLNSILLFSAALIVGLVSALGWRRRKTPGGTALIWMLIAVALWALVASFESISLTLAVKIVWAKAEFFFAISAIPLLVTFSLQYTRRVERLSRRNLFLLWALPVVSVLLTFTNEWHHLVWTTITLNPDAGKNIYVYGHGVWFWIHIVYMYLCVAGVTAMFVLDYLRAPHLYRKQFGAFLLASIFPWIGSIAYLSNLNLLPGLDLTPFSFAFTGIILMWGFSQYRFLDLVPIARDMLVEKLDVGVLVLDVHNRLLDANPAALRIFGWSSLPVGQNALSIFRNRPSITAWIRNPSDKNLEILLIDDPPFFGDMRLIHVTDRYGEVVGTLINVNDITHRKQYEAALQAKTNELEHLASTDDLTGLFNRRHMDRILEREIRRAERYGPPLAIALLDVDNFKRINDAFGHARGDQTLKTIAIAIREIVRFTDYAGRIGGDEFLIVYPQTAIENAWIVTDRLRNRLNAALAEFADLSVSVSGGVIGWTLGSAPEQTMIYVDRILYQAKETGKNRILKG